MKDLVEAIEAVEASMKASMEASIASTKNADIAGGPAGNNRRMKKRKISETAINNSETAPVSPRHRQEIKLLVYSLWDYPLCELGVSHCSYVRVFFTESHLRCEHFSVQTSPIGGGVVRRAV